LVTARIVGARSPGVLIVPAFAEEMNKSRRMVTELASALAARGVSTIVPDLTGTGDSDGEFAAASVGQWLDDLVASADWSKQLGVDIRSMLGVRFGSLLATELARSGRLDVERAVFWQPVVDGARMIDQFLRLRVAAQMIGDGAKETVAGLRATVRTAPIEIAGYELSSALIDSIDAMKLTADAGRALGAMDWIEISRSAETPLGAASTRAIEALESGGCNVRLHTMIGDPFWMSTEIVTSATLVATSVAAFGRVA
jgi:exosortase A-associated hydrolase 2